MSWAFLAIFHHTISQAWIQRNSDPVTLLDVYTAGLWVSTGSTAARFGSRYADAPQVVVSLWGINCPQLAFALDSKCLFNCEILTCDDLNYQNQTRLNLQIWSTETMLVNCPYVCQASLVDWEYLTCRVIWPTGDCGPLQHIFKRGI